MTIDEFFSEFTREGKDEEWECSHTLSSHTASVWDVLIVESKVDTYLTGTSIPLPLSPLPFLFLVVTLLQHLTTFKIYPGSADTVIKLWSGSTVKQVFKGHTEAVRALAMIGPPLSAALFASASNDGTIRIWSLSGDLINVLSHGNYIYALVALMNTKENIHADDDEVTDGALISSGEDGVIKIWRDEDGEMVQEIRVPALSGMDPLVSLLSTV
jgi:WD40 repeat protein